MAVVDSLAGNLVVETFVASADGRLRSLVQQAINHAGYAGRAVERRRAGRYPFPRLIRLSPVDADGATPLGENVVVVGKHLSPRGLDFFHQQPLAHRRMVAWLETQKTGGAQPVLVELLWCRFTKEGWYQSGGRLLRALDLPALPAAATATAASY